MAEKILNTRIKLKYDSWEKWNTTTTPGAGGNLVLLAGELGICYIPTGTTASATHDAPPQVMFKVGDGSTAFKDLPWASAKASDVYGWAKKTGIDINTTGNGNFVTGIAWDTTNNRLNVTTADIVSEFKVGSASSATTDVTHTAGTLSGSGALEFDSGNKWIKLKADTANKKIEIGHTVGTIETTTGDFKKFTYDAAGHITGATNVTKADITNLGVPGEVASYRAFAGTETASSASASTNGNTYIHLQESGLSTDGSTKIKIVGEGETSVTTDSNGVIKISSGNAAGTVTANTGKWASGQLASISTTSDGSYKVESSGYEIVTQKDSPSEFGGTQIPSLGLTNTLISDAIGALAAPMVFKGTIGKIPASSDPPSSEIIGTAGETLGTASKATLGFTYRAISNVAVGSQIAKDGDTIVCAERQGSYEWVIIPSGDEPSGTVTQVTAGEGLSGGSITSTGTISHALKPSVKGTNGSTVGSTTDRTYIKSIDIDKFGHIASVQTGTETVVNVDTKVTGAQFNQDATNNTVKLVISQDNNTANIEASLPLVSATNNGIVSKGEAVTTQTQSTKFLRSDGTWSAPTYTSFNINTNNTTSQTVNASEAVSGTGTTINLHKIAKTGKVVDLVQEETDYLFINCGSSTDIIATPSVS